MHTLKSLLVLLPVLVLLIGCERHALDRRMNELCRKDGGLTIHEKVVLPASDFNSAGQPLAKYARPDRSIEDSLGPDYRYVVRSTVVAGRADADLERGEGYVIRIDEKVIRRSDGRVLGQYIWYGRSGGDGFTFGFHPSSDSCPSLSTGLIGSIFVRRE
jgi:hypothetical protein